MAKEEFEEWVEVDEEAAEKVSGGFLSQIRCQRCDTVIDASTATLYGSQIVCQACYAESTAKA